jgi:hypothetical protein
MFKNVVGGYASGMKRDLVYYWIGVVFVVAAFTLAFVKNAESANQPHWKLDAIASDVAIKPVNVHCENSLVTWVEMIRRDAPKADPTWVQGYTFLSRPIIYIGPTLCETFYQTVKYGWKAAGPLPLAKAVMILAHEAVHQRGIRDEALTQCLARKTTRNIFIRHFGIPAKIKVAGKLVVNPDLTRVQNFVTVWHNTMPPSYRNAVC